MKFYGQDIIYDKENNIVKVWINKSFRNAWESRGWIGESIGLNNGIINYTITNKADLLVMIKSNKTNYLIDNKKLILMLGTHYCDHSTQEGVNMKILSLRWFQNLMKKEAKV